MEGERDVDGTLKLESGYRFRVDFNQAGVSPPRTPQASSE